MTERHGKGRCCHCFGIGKDYCMKKTSHPPPLHSTHKIVVIYASHVAVLVVVSILRLYKKNTLCSVAVVGPTIC